MAASSGMSFFLDREGHKTFLGVSTSQELQAQNKQLEAQNKQLEAQNKQLETQNESLEAQLAFKTEETMQALEECKIRKETAEKMYEQFQHFIDQLSNGATPLALSPPFS